ncbi:MAG TPA: 50S ribosomal protein L28 [Firmicutes bacterium]|nr:50S ribosomal protein L28 [Bacillota bacterium]HBK67407.1 50S ribosomal protein L28 [Bacillota bacterium]HBT17350.1 50S ribosomal protein L28 [Bacillota bacterium]
MSARCDICCKDQKSGNQVSHSNIKTKRVWKPNIKRIQAIINGTPRTIKVCTRCLRSGRVQRAI